MFAVFAAVETAPAYCDKLDVVRYCFMVNGAELIR